jgi:preprotein translocase subunit SecE
LIGGFADAVSHAFCKLLVALGDHSTQYIANNLASLVTVEPPQYLVNTRILGLQQRGPLVQTFLRLLLAYTSLPGYYGVDEEESDLTLGFWYLFQEALWNIDLDEDDGAGLTRTASAASSGLDDQEQQQLTIAKAVYAEAVRVLRRKVIWPNRETLRAWTKGALGVRLAFSKC